MPDMARIKSEFLPVRNEGKIREYDSCSDNESWSHDPAKRAHYLREWIKRNTLKCILPTSLLAKILMELEGKPKQNIKENQRLCCCGKKCKALLVFKQIGSAFSDVEKDLRKHGVCMKRSGQLKEPGNCGEIKAKPILRRIQNLSQAIMPKRSRSQDKIRCKSCSKVVPKDPCDSDESCLWNKIKGYFPEDKQSDREGLKFCRGKGSSLSSDTTTGSPETAPTCKCHGTENRRIEAPKVEKQTKTMYCKYCNDSDPEVTRDPDTDVVWNKIQKYFPEVEQADHRCSCKQTSQVKNEAERPEGVISCKSRVLDEGRKNEKMKSAKHSANCINLIWQKQTKKRARSKHRKNCNDGDKTSNIQKPVKSEINIVMRVCSNEFENIAYLQVIHKERKCEPTKISSKSKSSKEKKENPLKVLLKVREAFQELIEREVVELMNSNKQCG